MLDLLLQEGLKPFLISGGLVVGLLVVEIALLFAGLTSISTAEAPDVAGDFELVGMDAASLSTEFDIDIATASSIEAQIGEAYGDFQGTELAPVSSTTGSVLDFVGLKRLPLMLWLALFLASFAATGLALQVAMDTLFGGMFPALIASGIALVPGTAITRVASEIVSNLIPRDESTAISEGSLGRRRGTVTIGTARRGQPAETRITDHHGNTHYAMLEPLSNTTEIPQGSDVFVVRLPGGTLRLISLS
jgi:hypothetical protein